MLVVFLVPMFGELLIEFVVQLARWIVGNVEKRSYRRRGTAVRGDGVRYRGRGSGIATHEYKDVGSEHGHVLRVAGDSFHGSIPSVRRLVL
jgi:hypothetical protein